MPKFFKPLILGIAIGALIFAGKVIAEEITLTTIEPERIWAPCTGDPNDVYNTYTGNVGIGTTLPLSKLTVARPVNTGTIEFRIGSNEASARDCIIRKDTSSPYETHFISAANSTVDSGTFRFFTSDRADGEKLVIESNGNVGIGTTAPVEIIDALSADADIQLTSITDTDNSKLRGRLARAGTAIVQADDGLLEMEGDGYDGSQYIQGALIQIAVDGTPVSNSMPGRIAFFTTADGASVVTERMRIDNAGNVGIGTRAPSDKLSVGEKVLISDSTAPSNPPLGGVVIYVDASGDLVAKNNSGTTRTIADFP